MENMEKIVVENPTNVDLWIKIAYKKVQEERK